MHRERMQNSWRNWLQNDEDSVGTKDIGVMRVALLLVGFKPKGTFQILVTLWIPLVIF